MLCRPCGVFFDSVFPDVFGDRPGTTFVLILAPFGIHLGAIWATFGRSVEVVKNDTPHARKHTFRGLEGCQFGTFSETFPGTGSEPLFLSVFSSFGSPLASLGVHFGACGPHFGPLFVESVFRSVSARKSWAGGGPAGPRQSKLFRKSSERIPNA